MHRVTRELAHQECAWKHSEGHGVVALDTEPATSALTECAFSWKFALTEFSEVASRGV
jgi:hypothetical protein